MRPVITGSRRTAGRRSRSAVRGVSGAGARVGGPCCLHPLLLSSPNPPDYKKTSLAPYVRVFEQFVEEMERARRGELLRRSGKRQAGGPQGGGSKGGTPGSETASFFVKLPLSPLCRPARRILRPRSRGPRWQPHSSPQGRPGTDAAIAGPGVLGAWEQGPPRPAAEPHRLPAPLPADPSPFLYFFYAKTIKCLRSPACLCPGTRRGGREPGPGPSLWGGAGGSCPALQPPGRCAPDPARGVPAGPRGGRGQPPPPLHGLSPALGRPGPAGARNGGARPLGLGGRAAGRCPLPRKCSSSRKSRLQPLGLFPPPSWVLLPAQ